MHDTTEQSHEDVSIANVDAFYITYPTQNILWVGIKRRIYDLKNIKKNKHTIHIVKKG